MIGHILFNFHEKMHTVRAANIVFVTRIYKIIDQFFLFNTFTEIIKAMLPYDHIVHGAMNEEEPSLQAINAIKQ